MRCAPVIVLRATSTVRQAARQLEQLPEGVDYVVVVREHAGEILYYVFDAKPLRRRLSTADPDAELASAIHLGEYRPAAAGQLNASASAGSVSLAGRQIIGVVVDDGDSRGAGSGRPVTTRGGITVAGVRAVSADDGWPITGGGPLERAAGAPAGAAEQPARQAGAAAPPPGLFHAYPDVTAPGQVGLGQTFTLEVGFSEQPSASMLIQGPPVLVLSGPRAEFIIQVTGFGFSFPNGVQRTLVVERANPQSNRVAFTVRADPAEAAAPRILEVSYEFAGAVVGRTWAQVQVTPEVPAKPAPPAPAGGSGIIDVVTDRTAPHLSVDIFSEDGGSELRWLFHCRYPDIERPRGVVTTTLKDDTARSFAIQLMRQIPAVQSGPFLAATMRGVGELVADVLPAEFWPILAQSWQRAVADGDQPRMQITITEPWIPWELAWIDKDRFGEAEDLLPPDYKEGAALGQLWQVARWTTPTRHLARGDVPASPPASKIAANQMAVIIGNYQDAPGIAQLPHAVEEGNTIAMSYGALPLSVTDSDVAALMGCYLQRDGRTFEPTVIHFAGHGQTDLNNPQFTGLVLKDGRKLDPVVILGFRFVEQQQPFVFLNACEAGVAGETLMNLGGLVGAFLIEGARGFVAPLWKIDDVAARDIAVDFYCRTFDAGESVSEAMRQIRRQFTPDSASATALAYVFYGNPDLRFERGNP
jgi:hypothetical protein